MPKEVLKDQEYDLVSVIYNASQAAETCQQYISEAQGGQEVASFFNQVLDTNCDTFSVIAKSC